MQVEESIKSITELFEKNTVKSLKGWRLQDPLFSCLVISSKNTDFISEN